MSHDTWIHRIARSLVQPLAHSIVTPNHITTLRLIIGTAAACAAAIGSEGWRRGAAGLFLASLLLDRADGELARLSNRKSTFGHRYDLISDAIVNSLIFVGLGIGLRGSAVGLWTIPMGVVAGTAIGAILWLVVRAERLAGARAAELSNVAGFDLDDGMLIIPLLVITGFSIYLLYTATIGAPLFAIFFFWRFRSYL